MACILLLSSAVRVQDSQAYRKMDVTRKHISHILELREILQSFSGLEPSSVITEPMYLKLVIVSSFCPFTLIFVLMPLVLFVISLVFPALISVLWAVETLSRCSTKFASSSSSPAKPLMLSAKQSVIFLPSMLTVLHDLLRYLS